MRIITVRRLEQRDQSGKIVAPGSPSAYAQEGDVLLDGKVVGPTLERIEVMIPPGVYPIRHHHSDAHPHTIQILVPGRNWILLHPGNVPPHSEGCVLVGREDLQGSKITGGAPFCDWLEAQVGVENYPADKGEIPGWICQVEEPPADVADGVLT